MDHLARGMDEHGAATNDSLTSDKQRFRQLRPLESTATPQSREACGCLMRKGDARFKALLDRAIARLQTSGEAEKIYEKWFPTHRTEGAEPRFSAERGAEVALQEPERQGDRSGVEQDRAFGVTPCAAAMS
jgi:hypothetical protein